MQAPDAPAVRTAPVARRGRMALLYAVPIGILGGLIGLGGAEFRLPVLMGPLRYSARHAVPLNLAVSLITIMAALLIRGRALSLDVLLPVLPAIVAVMGGAVTAAFVGASVAGRLSNAALEQVILVLLVSIGAALVVESFLPGEMPGLIPATLGWRIGAGIVLGLAIGLVSSLLGVAGGELIIPTLVFGFGLGIKTAGTASLLISLPTVVVGLVRYASRGSLSDRPALRETVAPMGVGSVIGALIGGVLVGIVPAAILKLGLGVILILSALRTFRHITRARR